MEMYTGLGVISDAGRNTFYYLLNFHQSIKKNLIDRF